MKERIGVGAGSGLVRTAAAAAATGEARRFGGLECKTSRKSPTLKARIGDESRAAGENDDGNDSVKNGRGIAKNSGAALYALCPREHLEARPRRTGRRVLLKASALLAGWRPKGGPKAAFLAKNVSQPACLWAISDNRC